jgi:dephospho-CoA kinase
MILGVLGGIGSGKSTVTRMLVEEGAEAIDADAEAHEVIELPEVRASLRAWLGDEVFCGGTGGDASGDVCRGAGKVDRRAVARLVFQDADRLRRLENLLHPEVCRRIEGRVRAFRARPDAESRVLVLDVPLLLESDLVRLCDEVAFVDAPQEQRRLRTRDRGWSPKDLETRELHQAATDEKRKAATRCVDNSGSLEDTRRQVKRLYQELKPRPVSS